MSRLVIRLPDDRNHVGSLILEGDDGSVILGPFDVCGRADDRVAARQGNPRRNRLIPYGDTPLGTYRVRQILQSGTATDFPSERFGPNEVVVLDPIDGEAALADANGRFQVLIHGGVEEPDGRLRVTNGALRLANSHQQALVCLVRLARPTCCVCLSAGPNGHSARVAETSGCFDGDPVQPLSMRPASPFVGTEENDQDLLAPVARRRRRRFAPRGKFRAFLSSASGGGGGSGYGGGSDDGGSDDGGSDDGGLGGGTGGSGSDDQDAGGTGSGGTNAGGTSGGTGAPDPAYLPGSTSSTAGLPPMSPGAASFAQILAEQSSDPSQQASFDFSQPAVNQAAVSDPVDGSANQCTISDPVQGQATQWWSPDASQSSIAPENTAAPPPEKSPLSPYSEIAEAVTSGVEAIQETGLGLLKDVPGEIGLVSKGLSAADAYEKNPDNLGRAAAQFGGGQLVGAVGGYVGFEAGMAGGIELGFTVGAAFGGVGAFPGSVIGGLIGGVSGAIGGSVGGGLLGESGGTYLYDSAVSGATQLYQQMLQSLPEAPPQPGRIEMGPGLYYIDPYQ
jgi:hypothetical protein